MENKSLMLMAVEPLPQGDWQLQALEVLKAAGICVERQRSELLAWKEQRRSGSLNYADGWLIHRIWLAPKRWALGVTSRRLYFVKNSAELDLRPERLILIAARPQSPMAAALLAGQRLLVQTLIAGLRPATTPVLLRSVDSNLGSSRELKIGSNTYVSPPHTLNALYREHGFDMVPKAFTVIVCPLESVSEEFTSMFSNLVKQAGIKRAIDFKVRIVSVIAIKERLRDMKVKGEVAAKGRCVLFILPGKEWKLKAETIALFESLEASGVPFRRAYADDPLEYSIPDQLPSLVIAAGGRPHRSTTTASGKPVWTIGVDLSHRPEKLISNLVLTLVDPDGGLVSAWSKEQPRDETARVKTLSALLALCRLRITGYGTRLPIMVLRDGRMFEHENAGLYEKILETDVSLFEYRKRGNPQLAWTRDEQSTIGEPLAAVVPGALTMFVITAHPRNSRSLPFVVRITWRPEWNGLNLESSEIASMLAASATAPGLGLHPRHLPAAIYWADGIAGAGESDLRFVGVPVNRVPMAPFQQNDGLEDV